MTVTVSKSPGPKRPALKCGTVTSRWMRLESTSVSLSSRPRPTSKRTRDSARATRMSTPVLPSLPPTPQARATLLAYAAMLSP